MIRKLLIASVIIVVNPVSAYADKLDDAYNRGFEDGHQKGFDEGVKAGRDQQTAEWLSGGKTLLNGPDFKAIIAPKAGTNLQVGEDSTVAIIPKDAVTQFKDKLGKDFIYDNKILMNDAAAPAQ